MATFYWGVPMDDLSVVAVPATSLRYVGFKPITGGRNRKKDQCQSVGSYLRDDQSNPWRESGFDRAPAGCAAPNHKQYVGAFGRRFWYDIFERVSGNK